MSKPLTGAWLRKAIVWGLAPVAMLISSCATALEAYQATQEPPSLEMVIDRVNTAARAVELQSIMLRTMPISAASTWPQACDKAVLPPGQGDAFAGAAVSDAIFSPGSPFHPSLIRIRVLGMQSVLFESGPSLHYERKFLDEPPNNDAVRQYGEKVLGPNYNPSFNKSFIRFLRYSPDFSPRRSHFEAKFQGSPAEYFTSAEDAVISLADNREELEGLRERMRETEEEKHRAMRDIDDAARQVQKLKDEDEDKNKAEIKELENEIDVARKSYDAAAVRYGELLKGWKIALEKVRRQTTAFTPEQRALAANVQAAVNTSKSLYIDSSALVVIALAKLPQSMMNMPEEFNRLMRSPFAVERIKRIVLNLVALGDNASIIKNELGQLYDEAAAMDGLFDARLKTAAAPPAPPAAIEGI